MTSDDFVGELSQPGCFYIGSEISLDISCTGPICWLMVACRSSFGIPGPITRFLRYHRFLVPGDLRREEKKGGGGGGAGGGGELFC